MPISNPYTSELDQLLVIVHHEPSTHQNEQDTVAVASASSLQGVTRNSVATKAARLVVGIAGITVLALITTWSITQIHTGAAGTVPGPQPLPASIFDYTSIAGSGVGSPIAPGTTLGSVPSAGKGASVVTTAGQVPTQGAGGQPRSQVPASPLTGFELVIPSIGVQAPVADHGLIDTATGSACTSQVAFACSLVIPGDVRSVTRYSGSAPLNATTGSVLIAGHIDNADQGDGALHNIYLLQAGDLVYLSDGIGTKVWKVVARNVFAKDVPHPDWFAGLLGPAQLHLVTCGGPYDPGTHSFLDNVAITSVPA